MEFNFLNYMENEIAKKLKNFLHSKKNKRFFRISGLAGLEEFIADLPNNQYPALMVVEAQEGNISDNKGDNFIDTPVHEFYVVKNYEFGNHEQRTQAKEECKEIGQKILARMLHDKAKKLNGLDFLQFNHVPYFTVGPFGDRVIAIYFKIENHQNAKLNYNPDEWK